MALKKVDMEYHRGQYHTLTASARAALQDGLYGKAVELAGSAWEHIDGMMQYERKYEDRTFDSIEAIEIVLSYAPLLFDFQVLERLELLLRNQRRIDKHASDDLAGKLSDARAVMWDAYRLWNRLEQLSEDPAAEIVLDVGDERGQWRRLFESWERMGVTCRVPDRPSGRPVLRTRMDELALGKCPSCAAVVKARKIRLPDEVPCPKCRAAVNFVILVDAPATTT